MQQPPPAPIRLSLNATEDRFGSPLAALARLLQDWNQVPPRAHLVIDLSRAGFLRPALIVPIAALIARHRSLGARVDLIEPTDSSYMHRIAFPSGYPDEAVALPPDGLVLFHQKTYLPIVRIPTDGSGEQHRSAVTGAVASIIRGRLTTEGDVLNGILYLVSEALDNIQQHAQTHLGWVQIQMYPTKGYADVCIVDTGRGILGSYRAAGFDEVTDDESAMQRALSGQSVKTSDGGRGYGIRSSRRMLHEGLRGQHFLWSGTATATFANGGDKIELLKPRFHFPGTLLAMRIPLSAPHFLAARFVE